MKFCRANMKLSLPFTNGVASDRVYICKLVTKLPVSSYLAFPSLPSAWLGGLFLLHFPGGHPRLMLSVILPYEARTFLTVIPFGNIPRDCPIQSIFIIAKYFMLVKKT